MTQQPLTFDYINRIAHDDKLCRELLEQILWGDDPACPFCGSLSNHLMQKRPWAKVSARAGARRCEDCGKQFTVTVGTIFHGSHLPIGKWLQIFVLLCSSKKGMSAHQIHRLLGITYKSAWFAVHRLRFALQDVISFSRLKGAVEVDEAFLGGVRKGGLGRIPGPKQAIIALVQRGGGVHTVPIEDLTAKTLQKIIKENVDADSIILTDTAGAYNGIGWHFKGGHKSVNHSLGEFARGMVSTNTVEGFFSLLKRGVIGVYHHISKEHLALYLAEFSFRYNSRKMDDGGRTILALKGVEGKRLLYKEHVGVRK